MAVVQAGKLLRATGARHSDLASASAICEPQATIIKRYCTESPFALSPGRRLQRTRVIRFGSPDFGEQLELVLDHFVQSVETSPSPCLEAVWGMIARVESSSPTRIPF